MKKQLTERGKWRCLWSALLLLCLAVAPVQAQSAKRTEYGASLTIAWYQFDHVRTKKLVNRETGEERKTAILRQTASSAEEEIDYLNRQYGIEELKNRHVRTVGLAEGESFTDAIGTNDKQLTVTVTLRQATRDGVRFQIRAEFDGQTVMDLGDVMAGNYETAMTLGGAGEFGVREFAGPKGTEQAPRKSGLLITVTPTVIATRGLRNRPADLSRPVDQYGVALPPRPGDVFVMPALVTRMPLKFTAGSSPKGSITMEAVITPEGRVSNIKVMDSPDPAYNARAADTFRQYKFHPATLNGKPVHATWRETIVLSPPEVP
ncbi:MAG: energy transducer TonB [Blastocatellia bacterium]